MIDPANYDKPQPLRQLMKDRLSPEEWARLWEALEYCKRITRLDSDWYFPEHIQAFNDWQNLGATMIQGANYAQKHLDLCICGWKQDEHTGCVDKQAGATILRPEAVNEAFTNMIEGILRCDILTNTDWDLEVDDIYIDNTWYLSCKVFHRPKRAKRFGNHAKPGLPEVIDCGPPPTGHGDQPDGSLATAERPRKARVDPVKPATKARHDRIYEGYLKKKGESPGKSDKWYAEFLAGQHNGSVWQQKYNPKKLGWERIHDIITERKT